MMWTPRLDARLRRLYLAGEPRWFIADACGVEHAVIAQKLRLQRFTKIERKQRQENYARRKHQIKNEEISGVYSYEVRAEELPPTSRELAERAARLAIPPRDLTAMLCGDPRPGYSALERRS